MTAKSCRRCGGSLDEYERYVCASCFHGRLDDLRRIRGPALRRVRRAIRDGLLPSLTDNEIACVDCGNRATLYEHRDYSEPLVVDPVCRRCNIKRGPAKQVVAYKLENPATGKAA